MSFWGGIENHLLEDFLDSLEKELFRDFWDLSLEKHLLKDVLYSLEEELLGDFWDLSLEKHLLEDFLDSLEKELFRDFWDLFLENHLLEDLLNSLENDLLSELVDSGAGPYASIEKIEKKGPTSQPVTPAERGRRIYLWRHQDTLKSKKSPWSISERIIF